MFSENLTAEISNTPVYTSVFLGVTKLFLLYKVFGMYR